MKDFRLQLEEDIRLIQEDWTHIDSNIVKDEYAFNYWVLSRLYNIDEQIIPSNITEYNDKSIDCFVHFEESKELYIIQNKYYSDNTVLSREKVTDFLITPLSILDQGTYKRSRDLQKIFTKAKKDSDYKIWLHMYVSNNKVKNNSDIQNLFKNFTVDNIDIKAFVGAEIKDLNDIGDLYFGKSYSEKTKFSYTLNTKNKATSLNILPEEYNLPGMIKSHYIMTPVIELYDMYKKAYNKSYPLFEENIREFLGTNSINTGIIKTLRSNSDRTKFFYYNNGVTIICEGAGKKNNTGKFSIALENPQVVNGCQTMNSIYEVLSTYAEEDLMQAFCDTYVMVKILLFNKNNENNGLYKEIVKYTNTQNSIPDKAFASAKDYFYSLQKEFKQRGFLLCVKPSDKNKFKIEYSDKHKLLELKRKNRRFFELFGLENDKLVDIEIPLEKLLQVYLAFEENGYFAFTKKNQVLKPKSKIYLEYSLKIHEKLNIDNMIYLYMLYKKAEKDKNNSNDRKTPISYYLVDYISLAFRNCKDDQAVSEKFDEIFLDANTINLVYDFGKKLSTKYRRKYFKDHGLEYNEMIKKEIDQDILSYEIKDLLDSLENEKLDTIFESSEKFPYENLCM